MSFGSAQLEGTGRGWSQFLFVEFDTLTVSICVQQTYTDIHILVCILLSLMRPQWLGLG